VAHGEGPEFKPQHQKPKHGTGTHTHTHKRHIDQWNRTEDTSIYLKTTAICFSTRLPKTYTGGKSAYLIHYFEKTRYPHVED
jgi:hypothetical protein